MQKTAAMVVGLLGLGLPIRAREAGLGAVHRAELAFARQAEAQGIRTAFLAWLKPNARVFTPRMMSAKDQYGPAPGDPGQLAWFPEAMGMAASGDLAWSLGPWTYAARKGGPVLVHGHFLSIWRRQAESDWKVEADIGVPHGAPKEPVTGFVVPGPGITTRSGAVTKAPEAEADLAKLEAELSAAWGLRGGLVLEPLLAKEGRLLRPGALPLRAPAELRQALAADRPGTTWKPALLQVSASGDLAWACGETGPDDRGVTASFLRIWVVEAGTWKVLFDVRLPHPAPTQ